MKGRSAARSRPGRRVPFFLFFAVAQLQSPRRPKIHASCTPVLGGPPHSRNSHGLMTVHHLGMETSQCNAVLRRDTATTTARTRGASLCWTAMWLWVGMPNCFSRPGPNDDHDKKFNWPHHDIDCCSLEVEIHSCFLGSRCPIPGLFPIFLHNASERPPIDSSVQCSMPLVCSCL